MKRLHIDLAPLSARRQLHRTHTLVRCVALAALILCVVAGMRAHKLFGRLDRLQDEQASIASHAAQAARSRATVASRPIDAKQGAAVNAAVARLNLPWDDILDAVEAATPAKVALLSITPDPSRALLRIEAEGANSDEMIGYLKSLEQQPLFERVDLVRHELAKDHTDGVIRFQIEAQWRRSTS
ncbi:PilN domain-containing protein [Paraburkholderia rhizosphaerae]|uniref:Fimbrial assembly protein PilN n=1 Tax=Paraburkholderia rhizosphaerae TaxID=480658 RepID=A0A4R8KNS4_9BURK|nr:PilN domain-containing protein [Paraburkholderia rhizosphaerae]TDY31272.1 fimbrial assembly protein PilN [Paraburkholderia rhizosphaerae]